MVRRLAAKPEALAAREKPHDALAGRTADSLDRMDREARADAMRRHERAVRAREQIERAAKLLDDAVLELREVAPNHQARIVANEAWGTTRRAAAIMEQVLDATRQAVR